MEWSYSQWTTSLLEEVRAASGRGVDMDVDLVRMDVVGDQDWEKVTIVLQTFGLENKDPPKKQI